MKKNLLFLLLISTFSFSSCEYELDKENFQNIEKPDLSQPYQVVISAENAGQTVVAHYDYIRCKINIPKGITPQITTKLFNNNGDSFNWNDYYTQDEDSCIYISIPNSDGTYRLELEIIAKTNTGSIADQLGVEKYDQKMSWTLKVERKSTTLTVQSRKTAAGELELYWTEPDPNYGTVDYYRIYSYWGNSTEIRSNNPSCVVNDYFGESHEYNVVAYFKNSNLNTWSGSVYVPAQEVNFNFEEISLDSTKVSWTRMGSMVYDVTLNGITVATNIKDTAVNVPNPPFGNYYNGTPLELKIKNPGNEQQYPRTVSTNVKRGILLGEGWISAVAYNKQENVLYIGNNTNSISYQLPGLEKAAQITLNNSLDAILPGQSSSKVFEVSGIQGFLLSGKDLIKENVVKLPSLIRGLVAYNDQKQQVYTVVSSWQSGWDYCEYDLNSGELLHTYPVPPGNENYSTKEASMSATGKYFVALTYDEDVKLFKKEMSSVVKMVSKASLYNNFRFNPVNEEELYAQNGMKIDILNSADFTVKRSLKIPDGDFINIDSKTGNLLVVKPNSKAVVISSPDGKILLEIKINSNIIQLTGNILISQDGYALNLNKYLQQ